VTPATPASGGRHLVTGVLDGIRVLDFGRYIAGPFCAALLCDLGAETIRIERIGGGEDRGMIPVGAGPATEPFTGGGAMFLAMNRNRRLFHRLSG
jgi:crotonobetainyl-CoA:carnitine CoA-transferase CaiB-like acyl-CoA transferase